MRCISSMCEDEVMMGIGYFYWLFKVLYLTLLSKV